MSGSQSNGPAASFNEMIQADRKKRQHQQLADELLGSGRRASAPGSSFNRKAGKTGSLASRVGVNKRKKATLTPRSNIERQWTHDLHKPSGPRRTASASRAERGNKLDTAIKQDASVNGANSQATIQTKPPVQVSIKGRAHPGPFCVIATNFVQGTTSADIEMAFRSHVSDLISCRLLATAPQVTAELVIPKREDAENVVNTFNDSVADGNQLYVYIKQGPPAPVHETVEETPKPTAPAPVTHHDPPLEPAYEEQASRDDVAMDVEEPPPSHYQERDDRADRGDRRDDRRDVRMNRDAYDDGYSRYQQPNYDDGRYGFSNQYDRRPRPNWRTSYAPRPRYDDRSYRGSQRWR